jgi:hypothetical protein
MKNSICHNGEGIQEYLGRNLKTRVPHPVYSPEASPSDFWFFAWEKDQVATGDADLEDKLTNVWDHVREDALQSVSDERRARLECVTARKGKDDLRPHR